MAMMVLEMPGSAYLLAFCRFISNKKAPGLGLFYRT